MGSSTTTSRRRSCFTEEDDGLAFIADMEAGIFSEKTHYGGGLQQSLQRRGSFRNRPHFLEACFLCEKSLSGGNKDIFMYRGDIPFCSDECREEQIEIEELKEKKMWNNNNNNNNLSLRRKKGRRNSTSPNKSQVAAAVAAAGGGDYPFHTGAVAA